MSSVAFLTISRPSGCTISSSVEASSETVPLPTLPLTLLLADYKLAGSPALNTIVSGQPAKYTISLTPENGFKESVTLGCTNLPNASSCSFDHPTVTPNGSPVTAALTITTTKQAGAPPLRLPPPGGLPGSRWWIVFLAGLLALVQAGLAVRARLGVARTPVAHWKLALAGTVLAVAALVGSCRNVIGTTGGTPCRNYAISVTGTLGSNTTVVRTGAIDLSVTCPPTP